MTSSLPPCKPSATCPTGVLPRLPSIVLLAIVSLSAAAGSTVHFSPFCPFPLPGSFSSLEDWVFHFRPFFWFPDLSLPSYFLHRPCPRLVFKHLRFPPSPEFLSFSFTHCEGFLPRSRSSKHSVCRTVSEATFFSLYCLRKRSSFRYLYSLASLLVTKELSPIPPFFSGECRYRHPTYFLPSASPDSSSFPPAIQSPLFQPLLLSPSNSLLFLFNPPSKVILPPVRPAAAHQIEHTRRGVTQTCTD